MVQKHSTTKPLHKQQSNAHSATSHSTIAAAVLEVLGTTAAADTPLMSAGLDSIAATEFANVLVKRLGTELPQTVLFDHPTTRSLASFVGGASSCAAGSLSNEASARDVTQKSHLATSAASTVATQ
jgi:acyl carrier protein